MDIDDTDRRIIDLLLEDGRASYASIGAHVGLSPHGAADRVRRLRRAGVITGFTAIVDMEAVGRSLDAFIDIRLHAHIQPEDFERAVRALPATRELSFVTGRFDYHLRVACRDADELDRTVRALRGAAGAAVTETRIVMRTSSWKQPVA